MFVDWPEYKERLEQLLLDALQARIRARAPLTESIRHITITEGDSIVILMPSGESTEVKPQPHVAKVEYERAERKRGPAFVLQAMDDLADRMANNMERGMVDLVRESAASGGGAASLFRGGDTAALGESLLQAVRAMDIQFDDDGKPTVGFIAHPDAIAQMIALDESDDLRQRFDEIIQEKRYEWNRREDRRRLVD